jgi:hypothetical protein
MSAKRILCFIALHDYYIAGHDGIWAVVKCRCCGKTRIM